MTLDSKGNKIPDAELYIVHDKTTKVHAFALSEKLTGRYKCAVWKEKNFKDSENSLCNSNRVLLLSQSLIDEYISIEVAETHKLSEGVSLISMGNMYGITVDPSVIVEKSFFGRNWWKYLLTLVAAGLIGSAILTPFLIIKSPKKKARIKLYFDAVKALINNDNIKLIIPD